MITFSRAMQLTGYKHAAHAMLFAKQNGRNTFGKLRAAVMMQLRFDGSFGFPGGLIDAGEDILTGLNRELKEEIGWNVQNQVITWDHYYHSSLNNSKHMVLHFFVCEIQFQQFTALEKNCLKAPEFGKEVFGLIRVPLYTMSNGYSGLPAFLNNFFIGMAKQQLLLALHDEGILTVQEIMSVLQSTNNPLGPSRM